MIVGAQFYTLRHSCEDLEGFAESLARVADIGYTTVQISGICSYEPQWLDEQLKKNGLKCVLTHKSLDLMKEDATSLCKEHDVYGCKYIGLGSYKFEEGISSEVEEFKRIATPIAEEFKRNGKYLMYHNHAKEFKKNNNVTLIEEMSLAMPADLMGFTLDTYWVQVAGGDSAQWLRKLKNRVPCIHLKDCGYKQIMLPVGEGNINFDAVFAAAEEAGTEYMLVEQDNCNGEDPFDCMRRSYNNLKAFGFR